MSDRTNLCTNPIVALNTTGWTGTAPVRVTLPDEAVPVLTLPSGREIATAITASRGSAGGLLRIDAAVVSGKSYTFSQYLYIGKLTGSATIRFQILNEAGASKALSAVVTTVGEWLRLDVTFTADSTGSWRFFTIQGGAGESTVHATATLIEQSSELGTYFDGDTPGFRWDGTAHASTSSTQPFRVAVTREYPPDKLAIEVTPPGGAPARWAADEPLAENVASGIRLSDEMPGGHKELTATLARNPRTPWPDTIPFGGVRAYGPGVEDIWAGRLDKAPEADGDHASVEPAAVGYQAALDDDKAVIGPGFLHADLSAWGEPSTERRLQLIEAGIRLMGSASVGKSSLDPGAIEAALVHDFNNVTTVATDTEAAESVFDAGGVDIGSVRYDTSGDLSGVGASANWESNVALGTTDTFTSAKVGTDHDASSASNQSVTGGAGYTFARIRNRLNAASEGEDLKRIFAWQPKVIGNHDLSPQGEWPEIGFTAKQMLEWAIPLYTDLLVSDEAIEDDGYVIPHAWFSEPGPMSQVVQELTKYGLLDWFVFGGKLFQLRFPGTYGRKWQAYAGPSQLQEVGEDASRLWRSIVVRYQDVDGSTRTVGPPGSGATVEDEGLEITDPDHPAVRAGITRQDMLDMKGVGVSASAIAVGERWLEEANLLSRSGSCSLSGYALDDRGVMRPVSQVRAGDQVRFPDSADTSYRKIVARDYDHDSRTTALTLDAPPEAMEALLERLQASLISLGL